MSIPPQAKEPVGLGFFCRFRIVAIDRSPGQLRGRFIWREIHIEKTLNSYRILPTHLSWSIFNLEVHRSVVDGDASGKIIKWTDLIGRTGTVKYPTYGIIGRGRVARHMTRYLELEGRPTLSWSRQHSNSPENTLASADFILLAISDDALEKFLREHAGFNNTRTVHFSGSRHIPQITGLHPLMSFGPEHYDLATYRSIPFIEEKGGLPFQEIFPGLSNPSRALDIADKARYHALCVLAGNFSTMLWMKTFTDFENKLNLPVSLLIPYLQRLTANIAASPRRALTGALSRGDLETIRLDLEALRGDPWQEVFSSFVQIFEKQEAGT